MTEQMKITTERVDDLPLLLAHSAKMGVPELLDDYFKPHGNWEGMSLGWTTAIWLTHILSEGDHRMNQVQGWAAHRVQTLSICSGQTVSERGFRDDRLALVLDALRACLKRSSSSQSTQHQASHRKVNHGFTTSGEPFIL